MPWQTTCRIFVADQRSSPESLEWEHWLQDPGLELTLGSIKQWELTQRTPLEYKTCYHPTTSSTLCRLPHLNNKQNKNTNPIISRQEYHLTQPCPSEEKQTNNQTDKISAQISPYTKLTQTTGPILGGQKSKKRNYSTFKPLKWDLKYNKFKK